MLIRIRSEDWGKDTHEDLEREIGNSNGIIHGKITVAMPNVFHIVGANKKPRSCDTVPRKIKFCVNVTKNTKHYNMSLCAHTKKANNIL